MNNNFSIPPKNKNVFYVGLLSFFGGFLWDKFGPAAPFYFGAAASAAAAILLLGLAKFLRHSSNESIATIAK